METQDKIKIEFNDFQLFKWSCECGFSLVSGLKDEKVIREIIKKHWRENCKKSVKKGV